MLIIIQEINILVYCIYLQILDYNTKNNNSSLLYIPEILDYNTISYTHDILDYNTISYTHESIPHLHSNIWFYKGEPLFPYLFCTANIRTLIQISSKTLEYPHPNIQYFHQIH